MQKKYIVRLSAEEGSVAKIGKVWGCVAGNSGGRKNLV